MNFKCEFDKEPCVIDEALIYESITRSNGELIKKDEEVPYHKVRSLRLDFLDILQIDNLWVLNGIEKLQLSNNVIEKIENLESLIHLKELDLSFNNITRIENLSCLQNLESLTLFENKIKKLENLDSLSKLKVFSVGNNRLDSNVNVVYLRKFKALRSLNLSGNPLCHQKYFKELIYAYLPNISYYEYRKITDEDRKAARNMFGGELIALEDEERSLENEELSKQARMEQEEMNKTAFVEYLAGNHLFNAMFAQDAEGEALLLMADEIHEINKDYMKNFSSVTEEIHACGLQQLEVRSREIAEYEKNVNEAKQRSFNKSREVLNSFLLKKHGMLNKLKSLLDTDEEDGEAMTQLSAQILVTNEEFQELCLETWYTLMGEQLYLFEAIEKVNAILEINLSQEINSLVESAQAKFTQLRVLEDAYSEATAEVAARYQTRLTLMIAANKDIAISPMLFEIMRSKKSVACAISLSHDAHLHVIDHREDELVSSARSWLRQFLNHLVSSEIIRNRNHITEINHFLDSQKDELHALLSTPMLPNEIQDALQ